MKTLILAIFVIVTVASCSTEGQKSTLQGNFKVDLLFEVDIVPITYKVS